MDLFGRVNAVYSEFFGSSPPARACVGVDLPENVRVRLDCVAIKEKSFSDRHSLHVQGLSYWAPANIGPYSQAITVRIVLLSSSVSNLKCNFRLVNVYLYQDKSDSFQVNLLSHLHALSPQNSHWLLSTWQGLLLRCKRTRAEDGMGIHS
jgi:hypothetical protein